MKKQSLFFSVFFCFLFVCNNTFAMKPIDPNVTYYYTDEKFKEILSNVYQQKQTPFKKQYSFEKFLVPPIFLALARDDFEKFKSLINKDKVNINSHLKIQTDKSIIDLGVTPLIMATLTKKSKFVKYLLENKANEESMVVGVLYKITLDKKNNKIKLRKYEKIHKPKFLVAPAYFKKTSSNFASSKSGHKQSKK